MADGRYFAWVHNVMAWSVPHLVPQLIVDAGQFDYVITQLQNVPDWKVIAKRVLSEDEYDLTLDDLIKKYPAPPMRDDDVPTQIKR